MHWWESDQFTGTHPIPGEFQSLAGPKGTACVRVWPNGKTDPGWGMTKDKTGRAFMENYEASRFDQQIALIGWISRRWDFAFVMRSMKMVCIDIDGKNGGMANVGKLGLLPPTLAETSRSGDGYHLFYSTPWDSWDEDKGFAMFRDRIGLVPGVDIRAVGCVFHYDTQLWNDRRVAPLTDYLKDTWLARVTKAAKEIDDIVEMLDRGEEDEVLAFQGKLANDLASTKILPGKRNSTLFAIGSQLMMAHVPGWQRLVEAKAIKVGLDPDEIDKLLKNIDKYGANA